MNQLLGLVDVHTEKSGAVAEAIDTKLAAWNMILLWKTFM